MKACLILYLLLVPALVNAVDYDREIQPLLADLCYACHGPDAKTREADLRFDQRDSALQVIKPGSISESELMQRLLSQDPEIIMPPPEVEKRPEEEDKALLEQWITEGAEFTKHWAFEPIEKAPLPEVKHTPWPRNEIDHFILAKLEAEGLEPSPEADAVTLARRLSLDFRGLPPTLEELDRLPDESYEETLRAMLVSAHYGERMAQDWLDLARYGDTNGYHNDSVRAMWLYRDYVIAAFNQNMPYDQFIIENMAGDLLPEASEQTRIASGFNRCVTFNEEGGADPDEFYVTYAVDRANTTGQVFLGLTVGCAQCHDHKYDPISQKEYYQLFAFFNSVDGELGAGGQLGYHNKPLPPLLKVKTPEVKARLAKLEAAVEKAEADLTSAKNQPAYRDPSGPLREAMATWEEGLEPEKADSLTVRGGLTLWLDAARTAQECGLVRTWHDASGHEFHATATGEVKLQELPEFHGQPSVHLDGESTFLRTSQGAEKLKGGFTMVMVASFYRQGGHQMPFMWGDESVGKRRAFWKAEGGNMLSFNGYGADVVGTKAFEKGRPAIVMITKNGPDHEIILSLNGEDAGTGKPALQPFSNEAITIGANNAGNENAYVDIGEVLVYDCALRSGEQAQVGAWLSEKYGIESHYLPAPKGILAITNLTLEERTAEQRQEVFDYFVKEVHPESRELRHRLESILAKAKQAYAKEETAIPTTMVMVEMKERKVARVLMRGDFQQPGEEVTPDVPAIFPRLPEDQPRNRLGLAHWLSDTNNPLVARVTVNRLWKQLFGTGLVKTLGDFGTQGERPSHPELLDWLAADFVEHGWDVKRLQSLMATSQTYRQQSHHNPGAAEHDPDNRLLSRAPRFRLAAEEIRDSALRISGVLNPTIGGPSVMPPQPMDYLKSIGKSWKDSEGDDRFRRGLYTFWRRTMLYPTFQIFDAPSREFCSVNRPRTNTPLQALVTLNDPAFVEAARGFGKRIQAFGQDDTERLRAAFRAVTSRYPNAAELNIIKETLLEQRNEFQAHPDAAKKFSLGGDHETAAWAALGNILLNLDETITRE